LITERERGRSLKLKKKQVKQNEDLGYASTRVIDIFPDHDFIMGQ
jgi:hypothetical protein